MSEKLSEAVAAELRRLLADRAWSQRELARRSGLLQSNLTRKLSGERRFEIDELADICRALDVDLASLITAATRI